MKWLILRWSWTFVVTSSLAASAQAVTRTWTDASITHDSKWSTASNWSGNSQPTSSDDVVFPSSVPFFDFSITLSSGEHASSLTFNNLYQLQGGSLTLGSGSVTVADGSDAIIASVLQGSAGLSVNGGGRLALSGVNTFTGNVTFHSGSTLAIDADSRLGNSANSVVLEDGGQLITTASMTTPRTFIVGRPLLFGDYGAIQQSGGTTLTLNGSLQGPGSLGVVGAGTLVLNAAGFLNGFPTSISNGTVRLNNGSALGTSEIFLSSGTLELATGITANNEILLDENSILRTAGAGAVAGGDITNNSSALPVFIDTGPTASATLQFGQAGVNSYVSAGAGGKTVIIGLGTVTVPGNNTYSGDWQIDSGTLRITSATALGTGSSPVVVNSGGTLEINNLTLDRVVTLNNGSTLAGTGASARANGTVTVSGTADVFLGTGVSPTDVFTLGDGANDLTGGAAGSSISVVGAGKVVLTQNSNYLGDWFVSSGTLQVSNPTGSATGSGSVRVTNAGALEGTGSIAGAVENFGTVAPGASPGKLMLGSSYTQNAGGSLKIELAGTAPGTGYDQLLVSGAASLAGTLQVSLVGGFKPATGSAFDVVVGGSRSGTFGTPLLPDLGGRIEWNTTYTATKATLSVLATYYAGDFDRDSLVNIADVAAMERAFTDLTTYQATAGSGGGALTNPQLLLIGNFDADSAVTNTDLQGMINLLANGGGSGSISVVPEPATIGLTLLGAAIVGLALGRRSRYGYN